METFQNLSLSAEAAVAELSRNIETANWDNARQYFERNGLTVPHVAWQPDVAQTSTIPIQLTYEYWKSFRTTDSIPGIDTIDPIELRASLGRIAILDVVEGGRDFRYRLFGSILASNLGRDLTGTCVSQTNPESALALFFLAVYRAVFARAEAILVSFRPGSAGTGTTYERIVMPLGQTRQVERIFMCVDRRVD